MTVVFESVALGADRRKWQNRIEPIHRSCALGLITLLLSPAHAPHPS